MSDLERLRGGKQSFCQSMTETASPLLAMRECECVRVRECVVLHGRRNDATLGEFFTVKSSETQNRFNTDNAVTDTTTTTTTTVQTRIPLKVILLLLVIINNGNNNNNNYYYYVIATVIEYNHY